MRFEKPHSLSYQLLTLTSRPETLVSVASKVLDAGLWLKSTLTSGAVGVVEHAGERARLGGLLHDPLTSSTVVSREAMKLRSTIETLIVGTRIA